MNPRRSILPLFVPHLGCPHDCVFCNQRKISGQGTPVTPAGVTAALSALDRPVEELAFYGGSFTALPLEEQQGLLNAAQPFLDAGVVGNIRVSTRPDAIDGERLRLLRSMGVTAVELGVQSMDDAVLRASGRGHTAADTRNAVRLLREEGFAFLLQMMTGLPGSSENAELATGAELAAMRPAGVRIYPTVILRDTPLHALWLQGRYREHTVEDAVRICARLLPLFEAQGIPVVRLGLNPSESLAAGVAGGAYDPALGEKVRSRVYLEKARTLLHASCPGEAPVLGVCKSDISQMIGQHRCNLTALKEEFELRSLRVTEAKIPKGEIIFVSESARNSGL